MKLNSFKSYIDRIIYLRGYVYYENGYLTFIKETEENEKWKVKDGGKLRRCEARGFIALNRNIMNFK